jgi:hypothetical protein
VAGLSTSRSRSKSSGIVAVLVVLLVASLAFGGVYFQKYQTLRKDSSKTADERNKELIDKINGVYELPKDETPVVAIVSDEQKFKGEYPVFTTAKLGDALLLYEKAGQAVLYRESENKIIGTATFTVNKGASVHIIGSVEAQNSTQTTLETKLVGKVTIASKATSTNQTTGVSVFDKSGENTELASQIATTLSGVVTTTAPVGETIPDGADIVIVMGNSVSQ